jgi:hemerythrin-like domain-containing protein
LRSRREVLAGAAAVMVFAGLGCKPAQAPPEVVEPHDDDITPTEDLMREHGLIDRVMLVYDECARRIESNLDVPAEVIPASIRLVHAFVHDYHEKTEEEHVFPKFDAALVHMDLVRVLRDQHAVGRNLTAFIEANAASTTSARKDDRKRLAAALRSFGHMYRPHVAREDTVLFPAFRELVHPAELDALGAQLEAREKELFGDRGFERKVAEIGAIEASLEIADLGRMTPTGFR